jgi:hypothetical protein
MDVNSTSGPDCLDRFLWSDALMHILILGRSVYREVGLVLCPRNSVRGIGDASNG